MAYPTVESVTPSSFTSDPTAHAVAMPATVNAGDLLLVFFANDGNATVADPAGWTLLKGGISGAANRFSVYGKDASGSEDGTTVDFVTSAGEDAAAQCYRISGWGGSLRDHVVVSQMPTQGSGTTPDPPVCGVPWDSTKNTLWIAAYGADDDDDASGYPANYTGNNTYTQSGGTNASASMGSATRNLSASEDDPGTFTIAASEEAVMVTVAVAPSDVDTAVSDGYAQIVSATWSRFNSDATAHLVNMPETVEAGDLLVCLFVSDGSSTVTTPGGWSLLDNVVVASAANISVFAIDAAGTEDGSTVDFVTSANQEAFALVYRVLAASWGGTLADDVDISADASGTSTAPDAGSVTAGWGSAKNLYLTFYGQDGPVQAGPTGYPTGYTGHNLNYSSNSAGTGVSGGTLYKKAESSSDDAGAWTIASEDWGAYTVAVKAGGSPDATPTPATVARSFAIDQAVASASVVQAPATVVTTVAVPQATATSPVLITPATVVTSVAVDQVSPSAGVSATPATVATSTVVPQATASSSPQVLPATIVATATVDQVSPSAGVGAQPATVAATVTVPQTQPSSSVQTSPVTVVSTVAVPQAVASASVTVTPGTAATVVDVPQVTPMVSGDTIVTPATVAATITVPQAQPSAGVVLTPAEVVTVAAVPQATASVSMFVVPATVSVVAAVDQAQPSSAALLTPAVIAQVFAVDQVAVTAWAGVTPATVVAVATVPQGQPVVPALVTPDTVVTAVAVGQVVVILFAPFRTIDGALSVNRQDGSVAASSQAGSLAVSRQEGSVT